MVKTTHNCNKCKTIQPISEFYKASWCKDGYRPTCKTCRTNDNRKRLYGVDNKWFEKRSKNGCELCGLLSQKNKQLSIDHNHDTGKVRGVLCSDCNRILGRYFEDKKMYKKVLKYLQRGI